MRNIEICFINSISSYPKFGFYKPFTNNFVSTLQEDESSRSEQFMRRTIDALMNVKKVPKYWPELLPFL